MEDLRTWLTGFALAVSLWALWWSWRGWRESNRPLVTVHVESVDNKSGPIAYNLVVQNSGNRPALNVRLWTDLKILEKCIDAPAPRNETQELFFGHVKSCFSPDAAIPLLAPGVKSTSSFGYSGTGQHGPFWKYRSTIFVDVAYLDIESHEYRHRILVQIRDTIGFGGGSWGTNAS